MIGSAIEKGSYVYIYDDNNHQKASIYIGSDGSLQGYTSTTVNIRKGSYIYTYDEAGHQKSSRYVG